MRSRISYIATYFVIVGLLFFGAISIYAQTFIEDTVSVTATVAQDNMIIFSGDACPSCQVFLLLNDVIMDSSSVQINGNFQLNIQDIDLTTHQFGVYAIDQDNVQSGTSTFSVDVSQGAIIYISDILVSPTLRVISGVVEKGENAVLSGYTVPNGEVTIELDGGSMVIQTTASVDGGFYHALNTSSLQLGAHFARAMVETATDTSGYSRDVSFNVVEVSEDDEEDDEEDEESEEAISQTPGGDSPEGEEQQDSQQTDPGVETGEAIDFFVAVTNDEGKVSGGEYMELRLVVVSVADKYLDEEARMSFNITDPQGGELFNETYDFVLSGSERTEKRIKMPCYSPEGKYVIKADIEFDGQRFSEEATALVSRGRSCAGTGLETSLFGGVFNLQALCAYTSWLIALIIALIIALLILIYLLMKKEEEKKELSRNLEEEKYKNHKQVE